MTTPRVRRTTAILIVLACAAYLVLNVVDVIRLWLAYRACDSNCVFVTVELGPTWILPILWGLSLLAAATIGIWLTLRLRRPTPV